MKITILGSIAFADRLIKIADEVKKLGHEPLMHDKMYLIGRGELNEVPDGVEHAEVKRKYDYIKWWHNLIVSGDAILVCNYDKKGIKNYVGGNNLIEMASAHINDKKIFLLNPIPDMTYTDEIKAMVDVVLDGDLTKIV